MRLPWAGREPGSKAGRARFIDLDNRAELEVLVLRSRESPVVLFLHDPWCPISRRAFGEMERVDAEVHVVDVARLREMSSAVQAATGVRHESPQAFVLVDGEPAWHASHGRVRAEAIAAVLEVVKSSAAALPVEPEG